MYEAITTLFNNMQFSTSLEVTMKAGDYARELILIEDIPLLLTNSIYILLTLLPFILAIATINLLLRKRER